MQRRFTQTGVVDGVRVIDDYGHHPTEIAAVLATARQCCRGRVLAAMQPHRFTRLHALMDGFAGCFGDADKVLIAPVYAAGEAPIDGADRDSLVAAVRAGRASGGRPLRGARGSGFDRAGLGQTGRHGGLPGRGLDIRLGARPARGVAPMSPLAALPRIRGRMATAAPLARTTWFRVGGPAQALARPADEADLRSLLRALPEGDGGHGARGGVEHAGPGDGGVCGLVLRLGRGFADIRVEGREIVAGAAALGANVARTAAGAGIAGLEFLSGIPGTVGGALAMNAGSYGRETADVLVEARAMDRAGRVHRPSNADFGFRYRGQAQPADRIFLEARLRGSPGSPEAVRAGISRIRALREASQPVRERTGGSTFRNPPGGRAWELIDRAGCRGMRRGGAMISERHCNFLINTGGASAADLEDLAEEARARVLARSGVGLEWEIRRVGRRKEVMTCA